MATSSNERAIDWLSHAAVSIQVRERITSASAQYIVGRLSSLLLDRLPPELANQMLKILPKEVAATHHHLHARARAAADRSIGYTAFVDAASYAAGVCDEKRCDEEGDVFYRKLADAYLWAVAQELPPELKAEFVRFLPLDLRARMNIYSAVSEDAKVA